MILINKFLSNYFSYSIYVNSYLQCLLVNDELCAYSFLVFL